MKETKLDDINRYIDGKIDRYKDGKIDRYIDGKIDICTYIVYS